MCIVTLVQGLIQESFRPECRVVILQQESRAKASRPNTVMLENMTNNDRRCVVAENNWLAYLVPTKLDLPDFALRFVGTRMVFDRSSEFRDGLREW